MENERVRVLEYQDKPGDSTEPHTHPDSVMVTLSSFERMLVSGSDTMNVELAAGVTRWLAAQEHHGKNTGDTDTHIILVELKEPNPNASSTPAGGTLGPTVS